MTQPAHQNRFFASIQQTTPGILKQNVGEQPNQDLSDKDKVKTMFIFSEQIKMESMTDMQQQLMEGRLTNDFAVEAMI